MMKRYTGSGGGSSSPRAARSVGAALLFASLLLSTTGSLHGQEGNATPTFSKDVAPILQASCQQCHRAEGIAPMALETFVQVQPWAQVIRDRVERRVMPPWHVDRTIGIQEFANDIALSDEEIATIARWVEAGAPEGDPRDLPPPTSWPDPSKWGLEDTMGPPDLIVRSTPYTVAANGQDQWSFPDIPFDGLEETRYIRAAEFKPSYPAGVKVVHHGHASLRLEGERGGVALARYGIGKSWEILPEGVGIKVRPGEGSISWNLHYFPIGEEVKDDVVEIGVWFYPRGYVPEQETQGERQYFVDVSHKSGPRAGDILIPPHGHLVLEGTHVLPQAAVIESFRPHMHMRGVEMSMEAIYPDGRREVLSNVDRYNHNWQIAYQFAEHARPILPKGTVLLFHSRFDNTVNNPINPDPEQWVGFGGRGVDEMSHAWVGITYLDDTQYEKLMAEREARERANTND